MASLRDLSWHLIGMGDPGGGKSDFASTMPSPLVVFFFDGRGKDRPYLRRGADFSELKTYKFGGNEVAYRNVYDKNNKIIIRLEYFHDYRPDEPDAARSFESRMAYFVDRNEYESVRDFRSMAIDSSTLLEICTRKDEQYRLNPKAKDPRQWYAATTDRLEELYMMQLAGLDLNIFCAFHIAGDKDQVSGAYVFNPAAPGRLQTRLAAGFSELYRFYAKVDPETGKTRHYIQTRADDRYNCATQIPAPDGCDNNWEALFE